MKLLVSLKVRRNWEKRMEFFVIFLTNHLSVKTANSTAEVRGRGTVIIVLTTGDIVRISPVYHVPLYHAN